MKNTNKLTKEDVEHIAKLARIEINQAEREKYSQQLSSIFEYVNKLNEVDTDKVDVTAHVSGLRNVTREDEAVGCNVQEKLIEAAPENEKDMVKVKAVFGGGK